MKWKILFEGILYFFRTKKFVATNKERDKIREEADYFWTQELVNLIDKTADVTQLELNNILSKKRIHLAGVNLSGLDFSYAKLDGRQITFVNCKVIGSNFYGMNLSNMSFISCDFSNSIFTYSNISDSLFMNCKFEGELNFIMLVY